MKEVIIFVWILALLCILCMRKLRPYSYKWYVVYVLVIGGMYTIFTLAAFS